MSGDFWTGTFCGAAATAACWLLVAGFRALQRLTQSEDWELARLAARRPGAAQTTPKEEGR